MKRKEIYPIIQRLQSIYDYKCSLLGVSCGFGYLRDNMKSYMDNVVMLSEESNNNLMENVYVMGNKANYDWLMESKAQLECGKASTHQLIEADTDE